VRAMRVGDLLAKIYMAIIIFVIYAPIIFMILLSFNTSARISFPMEGFTLHWYIGELKEWQYVSYIPVIHHWQFWDALRNSIFVSTAAGIISCILVTSTALALRHRVFGRDLLFYLLILGFIVPGVILGLGSVLLARILDLRLTFWNLVFVDVVFAVPFGLILMMSRFEPNLMMYEQAASTLSASPISVFREVTLPLIKWEVLSAGILGFLLSWGELIRSFYVVRGVGTVSTYIYMQLNMNPITTKWFAAGTIIAVISFGALTVLGYLLTRE
jgi:putative spermidine/putrescine transport system permease protein